MNNKIALGLIGFLVIIGAYLILSKTGAQKSTPKPQPTITQATPTPTQTQTTPTPSTTLTPSPTESKKTSGVTIEVTANGFSPSSVTVKTGTQIIWINKTDSMVTVNSDPHPVHNLYPQLNLGRFGPNESVSVTLDKPGTYTYHNHLDPSMTGIIIVVVK